MDSTQANNENWHLHADSSRNDKALEMHYKLSVILKYLCLKIGVSDTSDTWCE